MICRYVGRATESTFVCQSGRRLWMKSRAVQSTLWVRFGGEGRCLRPRFDKISNIMGLGVELLLAGACGSLAWLVSCVAH